MTEQKEVRFEGSSEVKVLTEVQAWIKNTDEHRPITVQTIRVEPNPQKSNRWTATVTYIEGVTAAQEYLTVQVFRSVPGDVGISDVPMPGSNLSGAIDIAKERLESYSTDASRPEKLKPRIARVVDDDDDGRIYAEFKMTRGVARQVLRWFRD